MTKISTICRKVETIWRESHSKITLLKPLLTVIIFMYLIQWHERQKLVTNQLDSPKETKDTQQTQLSFSRIIGEKKTHKTHRVSKFY